MFQSSALRCLSIRVVALHLLDEHGVHTLLVQHWELQESCFCVEISWKLWKISKSDDKYTMHGTHLTVC